jgi:hypothetical protein
LVPRLSHLLHLPPSCAAPPPPQIVAKQQLDLMTSLRWLAGERSKSAGQMRAEIVALSIRASVPCGHTALVARRVPAGGSGAAVSGGVVLGASVAAALAVGSIALTNSLACGTLAAGGFDALPSSFTGGGGLISCGASCEHFTDISFGNCGAGVRDAACGCYRTFTREARGGTHILAEAACMCAGGVCVWGAAFGKGWVACIGGFLSGLVHGTGECLGTCGACTGETVKHLPSCGCVSSGIQSATQCCSGCMSRVGDACGACDIT